MSDSGKEEFYRRADVMHLLQVIKDEGVKEVKPQFTVEYGFIYPDAEKITGAPHQQVRQILEALADDGILVKDLVDTVLVCPTCSSSQLVLKLRCPNCDSSTLRRGTPIEHMPCGNVDFEEKFKTVAGLICQKCRKPLKTLGVDYRKLGLVYKCTLCGEIATVPKRVTICQRCGHFFVEDTEGQLDYGYVYRINTAKKDLIEKLTIDLKPIVEKIQSMGFDARTPSTVKGKSGVEHSFPLIVYSGPSTSQPEIVVDIAISERMLDETNILAFFAKTFDTAVKESILAAVPGFVPSSKKLAEFYNIRTVESSSPKDIVDVLWEVLHKIIEEHSKEVLEKEAKSLEDLIDKLESMPAAKIKSSEEDYATRVHEP